MSGEFKFDSLFLFGAVVVNRNIRMILAYDGGSYHGWQRQTNARTIQGVIEAKIKIMVGEAVRLIASGRTDSGVHAENQVCNFVTRSALTPETIKRGLNSLLPEDIFVKETAYVPLEFHSRYDARSKAYQYRVLNREDPDIFQRNYLWHIRPPLNVKDMARCLPLLRGRNDFSAFRSSGSGNVNPVRSIIRADLHGAADGQLRFVIEADGFLRHMMRNIVGTLVEVGLGRINPSDFKEIFESRDRRLAGLKAPPQGLFLMSVKY